MGQEPPRGRESISTQVRAWLAAIRGMRDNPVYALLKRTQRRRGSFLRRNAILPWIGALLIVFAAILGLLAYQTSPVTVGYLLRAGPTGWRTMLSMLLVADTRWLLLAAASVYTVWFMAGIFEATVDAMSLLSIPAKRTTHLVMDEVMAVSALDDRTFVTAMLGVLLPPLIWRVVVGAVLLTAALPALLVTGLLDTPMWEDVVVADLAQVASLSPLTITCLAISGALGAALLLLYMMAMSHGLRQGAVITLAATITAVWQLVYTWLALVAALEIPVLLSSFGSGVPMLTQDYLEAVLLNGWWALFLLVCCLILARHSDKLRAVIAVATPVIVAAVFVIGFSGIPDIVYFYQTERPLYFLSVWGSFSLINPLAIPAPYCWAGPAFQWDAIPRLEALRWPVLIVI